MKPCIALIFSALCLLAACTSLPQRDSFALLPKKAESGSTTIHPSPEYKPLLTYTIYREAQAAIVEIQYEPLFISKGYQLSPLLVRKAYGSLWGTTRTESLEAYIEPPSPQTLRIRIPAELLRHSDGPWDYSLRLDLHTADGKTAQRIETRLNDDCPEPGALHSNPDLFDRTYSRNREELRELQQAAARCTNMELRKENFYNCTIHIRRLSKEDCATLCRIISRMQPVHTKLALVHPGIVCTLKLSGEDGREPVELPISHVAAPTQVSPENVALQKHYSISAEDAETWFNIIKKAMQ